MTTTDKAALLARFIEERRRMPFTWGSNDCCLFAADWVLAATGRDIALEVDGGITPETAKRAIAAGANVLVAGTAVFQGGPSCYADNIKALRG